MKIFGRRKWLANNARADRFPISILDLSVGFILEQHLGQHRDHERINHSEKNRRRNRHQERGNQIFLHSKPQASVAECNRASFVEKKRVHIPRRLNGSSRHGQDIMLHQSVHARDANSLE